MTLPPPLLTCGELAGAWSWSWLLDELLLLPLLPLLVLLVPSPAELLALLDEVELDDELLLLVAA